MWDDDSTPTQNGNGVGGTTSGGFYVGRGRGFGNMSNMKNSLPTVGSQSTSNEDDLWNEDSSNSNTYQSSNNYGSSSGGGRTGGGGGSRACFKCGEDGHMSRDCPSGGGGGGGSRACFKCGEEGHMSRDCPNGGSGGGGGGSRACFKCNEEGHMSRDCPNGGSSGGSRACFKCGEDGHMSRDCPNGGSSGGGGGSRACFKCGEDGHMSRDCPNGGSGGGGGGSRACFKCNEEGHMSRDCPNAGSGGGGGGSRACFKCGEDGHMSRDCPSGGGGGGGGSKGCFKCGEEGHMSRECPTGGGGGGGDGKGCFKCGEDGHMARDCTKEVLGEDGKPKPPPYIPPEPTEDQDTLFESVPTGINFSRYDDIHVEVSGSKPPQPISNFETSGLNQHLRDNIARAHYERPTPVQKYAIPIIMAKRDLMACAQTGSGKTAAFLLPIIQDMITDQDLPNNANKSTQEPIALIIAPTRELVIQIGSEARKFSYDTCIKADVIYGGTSTNYQSSRIGRGVHILVATPGRLLDFVEKGKVSFSSLRYLILDEADRMLDMGFAPTIRQMVEHPTMPEKGSLRQTLMFSATFPEEIQTMAADFLHDYLFLVVGMVGAANSDVTQEFFNVGQFQKKEKLLEILRDVGADRTMVFVEQKRTADYIASICSQSSIPTTSIHGDRLQREREEALRDFRTGKMPVLVATAVAARGLDIRDVRHVINYDLPKTIDEYVHRIGRTGRVGNVGRSTSFYDPDNDKPVARSLKRILIDAQQTVPDWLSEEADQAYDTGVSSARFGGRDVRNKGHGGGNSNDAFNNYGGGGSTNFNEPVQDDECWD